MINILGGAESDSHLRLINKAKSMYDKDMEIYLHLYGKKSKPSRKIGHITITSSVGIERLVQLVQPIVDVADEIRRERLQASGTVSVGAEEKPSVLVTMGSDSDLVVLKPGIDILKDFGVSYELDITSAHRTPERMGEVAAKAASRGIKVIVAAAGGAAHLPGMVASHTVLPVIGVPVKATHLDGHDSLLSIVQMPVRDGIAVGFAIVGPLTYRRKAFLWRRWESTIPSMLLSWLSGLLEPLMKICRRK